MGRQARFSHTQRVECVASEAYQVPRVCIICLSIPLLLTDMNLIWDVRFGAVMRRDAFEAILGQTFSAITLGG